MERLVQFRFRRSLTVEQNAPGACGPLFHRWLPNGEQDAIELDPATKLRVWFEQFGLHDAAGLLTFHPEQREVQSTLLHHQGVLDAGPLFGTCTLRLSEDEVAALNETPEYEDVVKPLKNVVKGLQALLDGCVRDFITELRCRFGQYWLDVPAKFGSRKCSYGAYLTDWGTTWKLTDTDDPPQSFCPTTEVHKREVQLRKPNSPFFQQYLKEDDWRSITAPLPTSRWRVAPDLAARANELKDGGSLEAALVMACSALEVAIGERLVSHNIEREHWKNLLQEHRTPVIRVVAGLVGACTDDVEDALKAIGKRNEVTHDGKAVDETILPLIEACIRLTGTISPYGPKKCPQHYHSNFFETPA